MRISYLEYTTYVKLWWNYNFNLQVEFLLKGFFLVRYSIFGKKNNSHEPTNFLKTPLSYQWNK